MAVYGLNSAAVIDETAPVPPVGQLYPDSKIAAETLVAAAQAEGLPTTVVRPASTYGPRGGAWTTGPVEQIKAGRLVLLGEDRGLVNTGYIDNVVDGVLLALHNAAAAGETFNLCDGAAITYREFYSRYAAMRAGSACLYILPGWPGRSQRGGPRLAPPAGQACAWAVELPLSLQSQPLQHRQGAAGAGLRARVDLNEGMRRTEHWLHESKGMSCDRWVVRSSGRLVGCSTTASCRSLGPQV